jgi:hypothetical protein
MKDSVKNFAANARRVSIRTQVDISLMQTPKVVTAPTKKINKELKKEISVVNQEIEDEVALALRASGSMILENMNCGLSETLNNRIQTLLSNYKD